MVVLVRIGLREAVSALASVFRRKYATWCILTPKEEHLARRQSDGKVTCNSRVFYNLRWLLVFSYDDDEIIDEVGSWRRENISILVAQNLGRPLTGPP